jgi:hypothetical protein
MKTKDWNYLENYYQYAQVVSSRMLIEMILQNIPTIDELDQKLSSLGMGYKSKISENYSPFLGNPITWDKILTTKLS